MNSSSSHSAHKARTGSSSAKRCAPVLFTLLCSSLLFLPAITAPANPGYEFYSEFVGGSLHDSITQPYYDSDPYTFYKPEMTGSMSFSTNMVDLFPADTMRGYYVDSSRSSPVSFQLEGQSFSLFGDLSFDTYVGGSSYLSIFNEFFRLTFLFYTANFATDSANNLLSLPENPGGNDIDLWTLDALGGGYAYSDKAANVWHTAPAPDTNTTVQPVDPQSVSVPVPDALPLAGFLVPLVMAGLIHQRSRSNARRPGLPTAIPASV